MKSTNYLQMIEEAKIYGDAFVYAVPYKKAVARLLNKNNIRADLNMREQTIVSESNNNDEISTR